MIIKDNAFKYPKRIMRPASECQNLYKFILEDQTHTLIAGAAGGGKSTFMNGLIHTVLCQTNGYLVLCDPKMGVTFGKYKYLPQVKFFADNASDIQTVLEAVHSIMMSRYERMSALSIEQSNDMHIYVLIDELAELLFAENGKALEKLVQSLCQLGRAANIHMIIATQAPSRQVLKAPIVLNITCRVALHCESPIESKQILNKAGAELLPRFGQCIVKAPGVFQKCDVKMVEQDELKRVIDFLMAQRLSHF